jgi:ribonuclease P protein component
MLPLSISFTNPHIAHVLRFGNRIRSGPIEFVYLYAPTPKFSVIVSNKIDKRAVVRNRLRRLIHVAIQETFSSLPYPVEGIFIARGKDIIGVSRFEQSLFDIYSRLPHTPTS